MASPKLTYQSPKMLGDQQQVLRRLLSCREFEASCAFSSKKSGSSHVANQNKVIPDSLA